MIVLLLSVIAIFLIVFAIDLIPQFDTWQSRIRIGRFGSEAEWRKKIALKSMAWIERTPVIKLTDNSRLIVLDMVRGNYKRPAIQFWQQASLLLGLTEYARTTGDLDAERKIREFIGSKFINGKWKQPPGEVDGAILGYAILNTGYDPAKLKPAMDDLYRMILNLRGDDGTIAYRKRSMNLRYVDTIGFICPFLTLYGKIYEVPDAVDLAVLQIARFNEHGMLNNAFLPCHTYRTDNHIGVGLYGWGRGLGWYAIGLIDTWRALGENHPQRMQLTDSVIKFARAAATFQKPDGSWGWLVTSTGSRSDSSATATLFWFFQNASSVPEIREVCRSASEKAVKYLRSVTRRSGAIDFSQGDTKAIGVHSMEFDILPFTQGFALRTIHQTDS